MLKCSFEMLELILGKVDAEAFLAGSCCSAGFKNYRLLGSCSDKIHYPSCFDCNMSPSKLCLDFHSLAKHTTARIGFVRS